MLGRRLSRRKRREEKGAESAVSGFARDARGGERSLPITRRSFNYAAPVDRARTVRRR